MGFCITIIIILRPHYQFWWRFQKASKVAELPIIKICYTLILIIYFLTIILLPMILTAVISLETRISRSNCLQIYIFSTHTEGHTYIHSLDRETERHSLKLPKEELLLEWRLTLDSWSFTQAQPHVAGINELGAIALRIARDQRSYLLRGPVAAQGMEQLGCLTVLLLLLDGIWLGTNVRRHRWQVLQRMRILALQQPCLRLAQLRLLCEAHVRLQPVEEVAQIGHGS